MMIGERQIKKTEKNPHISCVIPAYNEGKYIGRLLESISRAQSSYHGGKDKIEVIVADSIIHPESIIYFRCKERFF